MTFPHPAEVRGELKTLATLALAEAGEWADPTADGRDGPRSQGLLDVAAECFLYPQTPRLRLSFGPLCERRRWYERHEPGAASISEGQDRLNMAFGYVFEKLLNESFGAYLASDTIQPWRIDREFAQKNLSINLEGHEIVGHPDGLLLYKGKPYAVIDYKNTTEWSFKNWHEGRMPEDLWGYPFQAANYLRAARNIGINAPYFLWVCGIKDRNGKHDHIEIGWATAEELRPKEKLAEEIYLRAIRSAQPLQRVSKDCSVTPCRAKTTIYCPFHETCLNDPRP